MKKTIFLICFLFTTGFLLNAQINQDSLSQITRTGTTPQQIIAYNILAGAVVYENPAQAKMYANNALKLAEKISSDSGTADSYNRLGVCYDVSGNYDSALLFYNKALPIYQKLNSKKGIGSSLNNIGLIAWNLADYDKAINYFFDALKNFEAINNEKFMANVLNNIGLVYVDNEQPALAISYHRRALSLYVKRKDNYNMAAVYNNLSNDFSATGNNDSALIYNQKAIYYNKLVEDDYGLSIAYSGYAVILQQENKFDSAKFYHFQALALKEKLQENKGICITLLYLASLSKELNEKNNELKYLLRAKGIAESENLKQELKNIFLQLSEYYSDENPELAFGYYKKYTAEKDSIFNETKNKQITEINTKYEVGKKELTLKEQQLTILKKNYWLIGLVCGTFLLVLLIVSYYKRSQLIQQKKTQQAIITEQEKSTIAVLQAEEKERKRVAAELHDGVGQMMSVARMHLSQLEPIAIASGKEYKEKYEHLAELIDESCAEVRNISHQMMPNALLKQGLAKAVRDFITQVKNPKLSINLYTEGLEENLPSNTSAMLYRIIQECVNNVIKHSEATSLDISVLRNNTEVTVTIEDNGKGFDVSQNKADSGIGLENIRDRVKFLKGELEIDSAPGRGTFIGIHIPVQEEK